MTKSDKEGLVVIFWTICIKFSLLGFIPSLMTLVILDSLLGAMVDNKALKFSPADNTKKYDNQGVWILKGNEPVRIDVELGLSDDNKTQIISDKVKEKDRVIISSAVKGKKKQAQSMRRMPL